MSLVIDSRLQGAGKGSATLLFKVRQAAGFVGVNNISLFRGVFAACHRSNFLEAARCIDEVRGSDPVAAACARQFAVSKQHGPVVHTEVGNVTFALTPDPSKVELFRASKQLIMGLLDELTGNRRSLPKQLALRPAIITGGTMQDPFLPTFLAVIATHSSYRGAIDQLITELDSYGVGGWLLPGDGDMSM